MKNIPSKTVRDRAQVRSSMPQLRPPKYLTKDDRNEQFHENYQKKLKNMNDRKQEIEDRIEDLELNHKRLESEESMATVLPADKKKLKKLIPIYRDKRRIKDEIKQLKEDLININRDIERVVHMEKSLRVREDVFAAANIDVDKYGERRKKHEAEFDGRYYDKKIDFEKLKKLKRGLYLDILENASLAKMTYKKSERKYDIEKIIDTQKQYQQDNALKYETAAQRQKAYQDRLEHRYMNIKMMRNLGAYHPIRSGLYPDDLVEGDDMEKYEYASRVYSASSASKNRNTSANSRLNLIIVPPKESQLDESRDFDSRLDQIKKNYAKGGIYDTETSKLIAGNQLTSSQLGKHSSVMKYDTIKKPAEDELWLEDDKQKISLISPVNNNLANKSPPAKKTTENEDPRFVDEKPKNNTIKPNLSGAGTLNSNTSKPKLGNSKSIIAPAKQPTVISNKRSVKDDNPFGDDVDDNDNDDDDDVYGFKPTKPDPLPTKKADSFASKPPLDKTPTLKQPQKNESVDEADDNDQYEDSLEF